MALHPRLLEALRERSVALHELAGIGTMAVLLAAGYTSAGARSRRTLRERWVPVLARHGVAVDASSASCAASARPGAPPKPDAC